MTQTIELTKKQEIVGQIRDHGLSVRVASEQYHVSTKTIYHWLRDGVTDSSRNVVLDNARLKKENEQLYALLGRATAQLTRPKR